MWQLLRSLAVISAFSILIVACSATWPSICPVENKARRCKCAVLQFKSDNHPEGKPKPAGVVSVRCDGTKLPVTAIGEQVNNAQ